LFQVLIVFCVESPHFTVILYEPLSIRGKLKDCIGSDIRTSNINGIVSGGGGGPEVETTLFEKNIELLNIYSIYK
jgi:hypothetical protein